MAIVCIALRDVWESFDQQLEGRYTKILSTFLIDFKNNLGFFLIKVFMYCLEYKAEGISIAKPTYVRKSSG